MFWQEVDKVLKAHAEDFMVSFIKLVFRFELKDHLEDLIAQGKTFEFYLLTGIGKRVGDEIGIEPADVKDLPSTVQALSRIFRNPSALNLGSTPGRALPWEIDLTKIGTCNETKTKSISVEINAELYHSIKIKFILDIF